VGFVFEVLGFEPWERQRSIMRSVATRPRTVVGSGHGVGKSRLDAALGYWWTCTRPGGVCVLTAPTTRQVRRALWREVIFLQGQMAARGINLVPKPPMLPESGVNWPDGRSLFGFTADDPNNVSGPSGTEMLVIVDEAAGVKDPVWTAIQSLRKGGGPVLATGNRTTTSGWFFDAFGNEYDEDDNPTGWTCDVISCFDSPNVQQGRIVIPGLVTQSYIDEVASDYGEESAEYAVRVLGQAPGAAPNAVIGYAAYELAEQRFDEEDLADQPNGLEVGVDVARFGDDFSTVAMRRGSMLLPPAWLKAHTDLDAALNGLDAAAVTGVVLGLVNAMRRPAERVRIKVDVGGGYGEGVVQILKIAAARDPLLSIVSVNSSDSPNNPDKFAKRRDELWWSVREVLAYGSIASDKQARREFLAATYAFTPSGQVKVESKDDMKKKLKGRSPDRADAICLAAFSPAATLALPTVQAPPQSRWGAGGGRGFG
jgi:phage terminase large subunit